MDVAVNVLCRNLSEERVIPRFSRYLRDCLGWTLTATPDPEAELYYLSGYFEHSLVRGMKDRPVAAYFTHREMEPPGNGKAALFDALAKRLDLRIVTAQRYAWSLRECGPTVQITPPVERHRFTIPRSTGSRRRVVGLSGFTYLNHRKGEDLVRKVVQEVRDVDWKASGAGWPVSTREYRWADMPAFYQSLDVLLVTSRVEGVPMPPLEAMACGVSVVVPRDVGLLDELGEVPGVYRYPSGDPRGCVQALRTALVERGGVDRERLREATSPYTIVAWCEQHRQAFTELLLERTGHEAIAAG